MKIRTKEGQITKSELFKVVSLLYLKTVGWWWLGLPLVLLAVTGIWARLWAVLALILFPVFLIRNAWRYTNSRENSSFYIPAYCEIDDEFIEVRSVDGGVVKVKWDRVFRVVKTAAYYLLYYSQSQMIYLPVRAFQSEADREAFHSLLKQSCERKTDMTRRSIGVTVGGIVLVLQVVSFLLLLFFLPKILPTISGEEGAIVLSACRSTLRFNCLLVGIAAIGIFGLRNWSRLLVLFMAWFGLALNIVIVAIVFWTGLTTEPEWFAKSISRLFLISFPWLLLSLWWLYLLNKSSVKRQFRQSAGVASNTV